MKSVLILQLASGVRIWQEFEQACFRGDLTDDGQGIASSAGPRCQRFGHENSTLPNEKKKEERK